LLKQQQLSRKLCQPKRHKELLAIKAHINKPYK